MLLAATSAAAFAGEENSLASCLSSLESERASRVSCKYVVKLSDDEKSDVRRLTRDFVQDASCTVDIDVDRSLVNPALIESDYHFAAPPQPVRCEITTAHGPLAISGSFAPDVVFKGGTAIDGTPGLSNVTGVNPYLAWPVVQYVNRSKGVKRDMLAMINAYRALRSTQPKPAAFFK